MKKKYYRTISLISITVALMFSSGNSTAQDYQSNTVRKNGVFSWPGGKQMAISLTFDDARLSQADKGIPLLDRYGIRGTFYISPDNMMKRVDAWKKAVKDGHEIGNHSVVHPCSGNFDWSRAKALEDYTLEKMGDELDSAGSIIKRILAVEPLSFAYPCGQTFVGRSTLTKSYIPLVALMFESGRGWMNESPNDPLFCDMSQLTGIELDGKTFDQVRTIIESARATGRWIVFAGHEMGEGGRQTTLLSTVEELCKYANDTANGIWIDNVHNIASYIRAKRGQGTFAPLPSYKNPLLSVNQRVDDLLMRMTLAGKVGQMNMPCVYVSELGRDIPAKTEATKRPTEGNFIDYPGYKTEGQN